MKAVLISIQPCWCELIATGKKTVEIRKTRPKLETPFKVYIYCTNTRPYLVFGDVYRGDWETEFTHVRGYSREQAEKIWDVFNGHIIGEFTCNHILSIGRRGVNNNFDYCYESTNVFGNEDIEPYITAIRKSCIGKKELHGYAKDNPFLYGWNISNLKIYDNPRDIQEFFRACDKKDYTDCTACNESGNSNCTRLNRPPQSWCYVEELASD